MKKGLIATFMVALILMSILFSAQSMTAISISNKSIELSDNNTLDIYTQKYGYTPYDNGKIPFVRVTIRVEGEEKNRVGLSNFWGHCLFNVSSKVNFSVVSVLHWKYNYHSSYWWVGKWTQFVIDMVPKNSRTLDNTFLQHFPSLNLLLQRLRILT
jgi:hypothetical protein